MNKPDTVDPLESPPGGRALRIDEYISKGYHLASAPHILPRLMPLLNRVDTDNNQVVELISYDTPLTANVMRVCNSAFYSRGTPINSLAQAVTHLGSREIYRIVVAVACASTLSANRRAYGVQSTDLWLHSVVTAIAAQLVAHEAGEDADIIFTAAKESPRKPRRAPPCSKPRNEFSAAPMPKSAAGYLSNGNSRSL